MSSAGVMPVASLTLRDLPDDLLVRLRTMAKKDLRSLNSEVLFLLEVAVGRLTREPLPLRDLRAETEMWRSIEWPDPRSAEEIAQDIVTRRTRGRDVEL